MTDYKTPEQVVAELIERGFDLPEDYEPSSYGETFDRIDEALVQGYIGPEDVIRLMREAIEADREQRTWQASPSDDDREAMSDLDTARVEALMDAADDYALVEELVDAVMRVDEEPFETWRYRMEAAIKKVLRRQGPITKSAALKGYYTIPERQRKRLTFESWLAALEAVERVRSAAQVTTERAHNRDRDGICRRCGHGLTALEIIDGEKPCAVPSTTEQERGR